eukprot:3335785-Rhodomonas_salina.1
MRARSSSASAARDAYAASLRVGTHQIRAGMRWIRRRVPAGPTIREASVHSWAMQTRSPYTDIDVESREREREGGKGMGGRERASERENGPVGRAGRADREAFSAH